MIIHKIIVLIVIYIISGDTSQDYSFNDDDILADEDLQDYDFDNNSEFSSSSSIDDNLDNNNKRKYDTNCKLPEYTSDSDPYFPNLTTMWMFIWFIKNNIGIIYYNFIYYI